MGHLHCVTYFLSKYISLSEFYTCIFKANDKDFDIFKAVVVIKFLNPFILVNIARCLIPP